MKDAYEKLLQEYYKNLGIDKNQQIKIEELHAEIEEAEDEKGILVRCPECFTIQYVKGKPKTIKCINKDCDIEFVTEYQSYKAN